MAKLFNPVIPIKVHEGKNNSPAGFAYNRKAVKVRRVDQQWRVREGWWRDEVVREYFQLETSRFVCMIYLDMLSGGWYLQRIYD